MAMRFARVDKEGRYERVMRGAEDAASKVA
jgi:hypothetical protein